MNIQSRICQDDADLFGERCGRLYHHKLKNGSHQVPL